MTRYQPTNRHAFRFLRSRTPRAVSGCLFFVLGTLGIVLHGPENRSHRIQAQQATPSGSDPQPLPVQVVEVREPEEWEIRSSLRPHRGTFHTRMGTMTLGPGSMRMTQENSRLSGGSVYGKSGRFLGIDYTSPNSRLKPAKVQDSGVPREGDEPSPLRKMESVSSPANTIAPAATASISPQPVQRPIGFFERPGIMESPPLVDSRNLFRTPVEQRWFRDIGSGRDSGLAVGDRLLNDSSEGDGPASSIGGVSIQERRDGSWNRIDPRRQAFLDARAAGGDQARVDQATARRRFEQKLEGMLLSDPGVHLLSPVQISFQNGVATVRGVVPSLQHKVAAGSVLLADPNVRQVNNLITTAPSDPGQHSAPIEPKE